MRSRLLRAGLLVVAMALVVPSVALGGLASDVQQGRQLAESIRSGERKCSDLAADDFELIGEYAMSRYLGSSSAHEAMNSRMTAMMGKGAEERMHQALGYRYTGCPGGPAAGWVGPMGGMMSGAYRGEPQNYGGGMMGGEYRGGMMGFGGSGDSDVSVLGVVLIALGAAALGAALVYAGMRMNRSGS